MENFTAEEIKDIESNTDLKDMVAILDSILDGETFRIRTTDTDRTLDVRYKPVLPLGLEEAAANADLAIKNKSVYAYVLSVLIALLVDLNPKTTDENEDYIFRMAIITNIIISGCISKNENWVYSKETFNNDFIKQNGKNLLKKHKVIVKSIQDKLHASSNFLAFSSMNMVRFNHHYPVEKLNLIQKGLLGLPEDHRNRIIEEDKLETFYNQFVTAARVLNDKKFYEKYILRKENEDNKYFYYKILGAYTVTYEEEIINIRRINTPNGFLICDIIKEIINDLKNRKILFVVPYIDQFIELMKLRNHLRANPFGYHPSKYFYNCKAADYDDVVGRFQNIMKKIGSFVYVYSENMFNSVREAKCRIKYEKSITRDDENLVKLINELTKTEIKIEGKTRDIIKEKLGRVDLKIDEDSDISKLNEDIYKRFEAIINVN